MLSFLLERIKNRDLIKEEKFFYIFALVIFIFQISIFIKLFTINCVKPDLLLVLLVFFSLNFNLAKSIRFALFIGLLKDLINPNYIFLDVFIYPFIVLFVFLIKKIIIFENIFLRILLVIVVSALYLGFKGGILYIKSGFIPTDKNYLYFLFLNLVIFLIFNLFIEKYEERKEEF